MSSHRSGNLYVWNTVFTGKATGPLQYIPHLDLQDASISTVKTKHKPPLLFRWSIGHGAINSFAFSPDSEHIAIASQDGFLRIYHFKSQVFHSRMRSYFGGFLCVCWSPDGCYVVTGGEDDLITVWSFHHKRVVARGEGHQSYITAVAFDPYTTVLPDSAIGTLSRDNAAVAQTLSSKGSRLSGIDASSAASSPFLGRISSEAGDREVVAYRLGSVGQDAQLCLWDLSEDVLKIRRPFTRGRSRPSRMISQPQPPTAECPPGTMQQKQKINEQDVVDKERENTRRRSDALDKDIHEPLAATVAHNDGFLPAGSAAGSDHTQNEEHSPSTHTTQDEKPKEERESEPPEDRVKEASPASSDQSTDKEKRTRKDREKVKNKKKLTQQMSFHGPVKRVMKLVGMGGHHNGRREVSTFETCNSDDIAPKMHEVNLVEPLVAERVDQERLSDLAFREDCIVVASYDGFISLWARPGVVAGQTDGDTGTKQASNVPEPHPGVSLNTCIYLHLTEFPSCVCMLATLFAFCLFFASLYPSPISHYLQLNSPRPGGGPSSPLKQTTV